MIEEDNQKIEVAEELTAQENEVTEVTKEEPVMKIKPLTLDDVSNVDELYKEFQDGKNVQFPPWLIVEESDKKKFVTVSTQELFIHIGDNVDILIVKYGDSKDTVLFRYENGCYRKWTESDCKAFIKSFIPRKIRKSSQWEEVFRELKTEYANTEESELNADEDIINFKNGILNIKTEELLPHSPEYKSTIQIPCNYIPNALLPKAEVTIKFLHDITERNAEDMYTLLEVAGLIVSNVKGSRTKKMLILKGPGNTGKSVWREFIQAVVGMENCFTVDIKQLHSQFGLGGIVGKRLVGSGDMKFARLPEIDKLKELTGGDHINVEAKYQNSYTTLFRGFLWFNCNELPAFSGDKGKHVYDRFLILSCDKPIEEEKRDPELLDKLLAEKDITVSVAVGFWRKAMERDYKFTESERTKKNREDYAIRNDSLSLYVTECCKLGEGRTKVSDFKAKYNWWCRMNNYEPERPNDISRILTEKFGVIKRKSGIDYYELTIDENKDLGNSGDNF